MVPNSTVPVSCVRWTWDLRGSSMGPLVDLGVVLKSFNLYFKTHTKVTLHPKQIIIRYRISQDYVLCYLFRTKEIVVVVVYTESLVWLFSYWSKYDLKTTLHHPL